MIIELIHKFYGHRFPEVGFYQQTASRDHVRWCLTCAAISVAPLFFYVSTWTVLITFLTMAWRWRLNERVESLPGSFLKYLAALGMAIGVGFDYGTIFGRDAGTALMLGFFSVKILEIKTIRDYIVVVFVSYFLLFVALLFSQDILTSVYLLVVFSTITGALVRLHRHPLTARPWKEDIQLAGRLCPHSLPLALFLFIFFPRIDGTLAIHLGQGKLGFSDKMSTGSVTQALDNNDTAFRVEFPDGNIPKPADRYWRGTVLWQYLGGFSWRQGHTSHQALSNRIPSWQGVGPETRQIITMEANGLRWLFALDYPLTPPQGSRMLLGLGLETFRPVNVKRRYEITSNIQRVDHGATPQMLSTALYVPNYAITPKVRSLAEEFKRKGETPEKIVQHALSYFNSQGFRYSLSPGNYQENGLEEFLFNRKVGFCEHYSSSFATLMRLAGVPSRIVMGYQGGDLNSYGDFIVVRQSSAHAWTEVYLGKGIGWKRIDPVAFLAPSRVRNGVDQFQRDQAEGIQISVSGTRFEAFRGDWKPLWLTTSLHEMRMVWDLTNQKWDELIAYDSMRQQIFLESMGVTSNKFSLMIFCGLAIGASAWLLAWWFHQSGKNIDPLRALYDDVCITLAKHHIKPDPGEAPGNFLQRAANTLPPQKEIEAFRTSFIKLRYGCVTQAEVKASMSIIQEQARAVKTSLK